MAKTSDIFSRSERLIWLLTFPNNFKSLLSCINKTGHTMITDISDIHIRLRKMVKKTKQKVVHFMLKRNDGEHPQFPAVVPSGELHSVLRNSFTWRRATDIFLWDLWQKELCLLSTWNRYISSPSGLFSTVTRLRITQGTLLTPPVAAVCCILYLHLCVPSFCFKTDHFNVCVLVYWVVYCSSPLEIQVIWDWMKEVLVTHGKN